MLSTEIFSCDMLYASGMNSPLELVITLSAGNVFMALILTMCVALILGMVGVAFDPDPNLHVARAVRLDPIPEPATVALVGLGISVILARRPRRGLGRAKRTG